MKSLKRKHKYEKGKKNRKEYYNQQYILNQLSFIFIQPSLCNIQNKSNCKFKLDKNPNSKYKAQNKLNNKLNNKNK